MKKPLDAIFAEPLAGVQVVQIPLPSKGEDVYGVFAQQDGSVLVMVIDGHGGRACAERARESFSQTFALAYQKNQNAEQALTLAGEKVAEATGELESGAVYTAVWLPSNRDRLVCAQLGDTAAFWRDRKGKLARTPDHNVRANPRELELAMKRGGLFMQGYIFTSTGLQGVQSARVIGDVAMGNVVHRLPEVTRGKIGSGFLVVCSDGLCDPSHADQQMEASFYERFLSLLEATSSLPATIEQACLRPFADDVTVLAVRLSASER